MSVEFTSLETFAGRIWIAESELGLCHVGFESDAAELPKQWRHVPRKESASIEQLRQYFEGSRTKFELTLDLPGTPFQRTVWAELQNIPYGERTSYGALAKRLGKPGASRAVGSANGKNRIAIVIPCHRVVASNGALAGFAWGTETKRKLLDFERRPLRSVAAPQRR